MEENQLFHIDSKETATMMQSQPPDGNERMTRNTRWKTKKSNLNDFNEARNGDHALVPFECDNCIFYKLRKQKPDVGKEADKLLMILIRRMNLDAFWARARGTVRENTGRIKRTIQFSNTLGLSGPFEHQGPYPSHDHCGYEVAAAILMNSRRPGRYHKSHTQFETIRLIKSSYSSQFNASPAANIDPLTWTDRKSNYTRVTSDKCGSLWFSRFMVGLKIRMGQTYKPNQALSHELLKAVIVLAEAKVEEAVSEDEVARWITFISYMVITYVLSLRGSEGLMLDLGGLNKQWIIKRTNHVVVVLSGKLKGEGNARLHHIPCVKVTKSGINVEYLIQRLLDLKQKQGLYDGPAISNDRGFLLPIKDLDTCFHELLIELYLLKPERFPPTITSPEEIVDNYKCFRSLRRTSNTRALDEKVNGTDIDIVNKWEQVNETKKKVAQAMKHHYAEFQLLIKPFLRYTSAM